MNLIVYIGIKICMLNFQQTTNSIAFKQLLQTNFDAVIVEKPPASWLRPRK